MFQLPELPYDYDALEPHISQRTIDVHFGKHHRNYVETLNELVKDTSFADKTLLEIIQVTAGNDRLRAIHNNAAQAWNHDFFWRSMAKGGGGRPAGEMVDRLFNSFGDDFEDFRSSFVAAAADRFGSGWVWLTLNSDGHLLIETTANAGNPVTEARMPLLTCDLWEHAYYLDYQNERAAFVSAFLDHLVDWDFATENLRLAEGTDWLDATHLAVGQN